MTELREGMKMFAQELSVRCLYDPLEFLFKIDIAEEFNYSTSSSKLSRAMNLFSMREYYQAYSVLLCPDEDPAIAYNYCGCCSSSAVFLRNYSVCILSSIKNVKEAGFTVNGVKYKDESVNKILQKVVASSGTSHTEGSISLSDPFLLYLLIISKKEHISPENFKKMLFLLIETLPYFWDVYKLLADIITISECNEVFEAIKDEKMRRVFTLYIGCKKSILHPSLKKIIEEYEQRPDDISVYEESLIVLVLGHYKKNTKALEIMERVMEKTHDWNNFDQFSNILYSLKDTERLSSLLFKVFDHFGNLPIYNYVSGNLLALKSDHISSIEEFQKILHDDFTGEFDIAYIFVAQEYFHLKDTCSAIKACNLAIKKNYNDYRVWLSMAQIYFAIEMHEYALHFYRKCAELSPSTPSIYEGLGQCFEKLNREDEAIRCYKKCVEQGSMKALCLLGDLFFRQNNQEFKKQYMEYIRISFSNSEDAESPDINMKTLERLIESLEPSVDSSTILEWRRSLTILKSKIGN
ncbi:anaphase-promoting complex subunit 8 [Nematocida minor]|uniref:anaphase-promoting complex subunit 8 n=1 Tax=Nematocida minor TaxID=1912983 RepID=UPI0022204ACE|nr:anaphase-promoting complex subunit 8 [Nematocida minor]KAI5191095.1 anaphase-promoting complex subunit 8 [Nematocida minor]